MRATDELLNGIVTCSQIPSVKRRQEIQRELRAHMEDFAMAAREAGHQEEEIETLLRSHFGNPEEVAEEFAWVYRHERRRLLLISYAASTVLVASSLLLAILAIQAGLAAGFGTSILEMLASRHTVIEGFDVLGCVAVYLAMTSLETLFEGHRFEKAALLVTGLVAALIVGCMAMRLHTAFLFYGLIAGVFLRAVRLFVREKIARAGIVPICFGCAGLVFVLLRSPISAAGVAATCASWFVVGAGYLAMTDFAPRVEAKFLNALERI